MSKLPTPKLPRPQQYQDLFEQFLARVAFASPQHQNILMGVSSLCLVILVLSGLLLYRSYDPTDLIRRGQWFARQGKMVYAAGQFERLVRNHPSHYDGHLALGKAYLELNAPGNAAQAFAKAVKLAGGKASQTRAVVALAQYIMTQGDYAKAEKVLLKTEAFLAKNKRRDPFLDKTFVSLYSSWGDSLVVGEDLEDEKIDYEKVFDIYLKARRYAVTGVDKERTRDKLLNVVDQLLRFYRINHSNDKAIVALTEVLKYEKSAALMKTLAELYVDTDKSDKALVWYKRAYDMDKALVAVNLVRLLQLKQHEYEGKGDKKKAALFMAEAEKIAKANGFKLAPVKIKASDTSEDAASKGDEGISASGASEHRRERL